ncbi:hypothetical protein CHUAL_000133 [Chamberlinius hualienensis]
MFLFRLTLLLLISTNLLIKSEETPSEDGEYVSQLETRSSNNFNQVFGPNLEVDDQFRAQYLKNLESIRGGLQQKVMGVIQPQPDHQPPQIQPQPDQPILLPPTQQLLPQLLSTPFDGRKFAVQRMTNPNFILQPNLIPVPVEEVVDDEKLVVPRSGWRISGIKLALNFQRLILKIINSNNKHLASQF